MTRHHRRPPRHLCVALLTATLLVMMAACDSGPTAPQVASIEVTAPAFELELDGTLQLTASLRDGNGATVDGVVPEWSSSDPSRAEVDAQGLVTGRGLGSVTIEASVSGVTGSITLEVVGPAPEILSIAPAVLRAGEDAILQGTGFSDVPGLNRVRIGGRLAVVLEASETELVVRVPLDICYPSGVVPVTASLGGSESDAIQHPLDAPEPVAMESGEFRLLSAPAARCLRLPASQGNERYLVGAQSTSEVAESTVRVFLEGRRGSTVVASNTPASAVRQTGERTGDSDALASRELLTAGQVTRGAIPGDAFPVDRWTRHRDFESTLRRAEIRALAPVLAQGLTAARAREPLHRDPERRDIGLHDTDALQAAVPGSVQPGDTVDLSVPDISADNFCQTGTAIRAVVRRVGSGSIWVEDVENPAGFSPTQFDELSDTFDDQILDELTEHFGETTDLDDNDRTVVVISQAVNEMSASALGFVVTVDFFPEQCPAGNGGEYYYARSPDPNGTIEGPDGPPDNPYSVADAFEDAPVLLAHESTHIIQFGRRIHFPNAESLQQIWELEGQATLAEELVGFRIRGLGPGQNLGFNTAFNPPPGEKDWFSSGFVDLAVYYGFESQTSRVVEAPHECGWLGRDADGPCDYRRLPYGVPWSFLRWISDHLGPEYPGGAQGIQRDMIDNTRTGFATLEEILGTPIEPLLARWAASLYADERLPAGADPYLDFPSWDLRSIDQGLVEPARLRPTERSFSTFTEERRLAAASSAYFLIEGGPRPAYAVEIRPHTGSTLPDHVQLWVVRLQ